MKVLLFVLFLLSCTGKTLAQRGTPIIIGNIDTVSSKILGETRTFWVYVPNNDVTGLYSQVKYPVVYLLDGDAHFYSVVGIIQQLSSVNGNSLLPEMIVVGITNTDRTRDLTPTHVNADPHTGDTNVFRSSGGGERFLFFIEKELMPYIDSAYPTLPYKTLIGHSFGGLLAIHALINHKHLFNNYVAIDPSMWWDNRSLLKEASVKLKTGNYKGKSLFMAIANNMSPDMDTLRVMKDTSLASDHIRSILSFNKVLHSAANSGLKYAYRYYNEDTHGSVPLVATHDALRNVFSFYDFRLSNEDFLGFSMNTIKKIEDHFADVSRYFGFHFSPPEVLVNQMGYMAMSQGKSKEAEYLFRMNISNYPNSFNVYDSMGDLYHSQGNKEKAVENYRKALAIREFEITRNKLNELTR